MKKLRNVIIVSISIFILIMVVLIFLAAGEVISWAAVIWSFFGFLFIGGIMAAFIYAWTERKKRKEIIPAKKEIAKYTEDQALKIIKNKLKGTEYSQYLDTIVDKWTPNLGYTKHPIFIVVGNGRYNYELIIGMMNLITGNTLIKIHNPVEFGMTREKINEEIEKMANLLSGEPIEKKMEITRREMPLAGAIEEIIRPLPEIPKEEKEEEKGGEIK